MKLIHKGERGFTLIELIIAIAIAALITGGITAAIMQILTINTRASNHMVAVRQVQQAGKEVSKDTLQAQNVTWTGSPGFNLTLTWKEIDDTGNVVVYVIEGGELKRNHSINGTAQATAPPVVAQYIDVGIDPATDKAKTRCEWDPVNRVLTFTVTATVGDQSETRLYEVQPRPGS